VAHKFAVESPRVTGDVVEVSEFPDMMQRYQVSGVPKIVFNETVQFVGAQGVEMFLTALREAAR
jgi:predicted DsbA family dithiol-disulfide isomerase